MNRSRDVAGWVSNSPIGRSVGVVLLAVLTIALTCPLAFKVDRVGRFNTGDGQFSLWNVSWVAHALTTHPTALFDANTSPF